MLKKHKKYDINRQVLKFFKVLVYCFIIDATQDRRNKTVNSKKN